MRFKSVIHAAVGGQGGGVLTEWIVTAAQLAGHEAQSISMPGMSQRGGATNLYLELAIRDDPNDTGPVSFSQYPFPGSVDVVVSQEYLELGRVLQSGYTSDRTTVVGSSHRLFAVTEKLPLWGGRTESEALTELGLAFSGAFMVFDALDLARQGGMDELAGVAAFKTDPGRFAKIRKDFNVNHCGCVPSATTTKWLLWRNTAVG